MRPFTQSGNKSIENLTDRLGQYNRVFETSKTCGANVGSGARQTQETEITAKMNEIKNKLNMEVNDEKVEQDIRNSILKLSKEIGMDTRFCGRLLNILLMESVRLQQNQQIGELHRQTHLGIFMKAKQLEAIGKKIIHI
jgi:aspartate aminotransferase